MSGGFANAQYMVVHGVLWVIDELHRHAIRTAENLLTALQLLAGDPTVRLPHRSLRRYIKRYGGVS